MMKIDKKIFGSFVEHIENCIEGGLIESDTRAINKDALDLCKELKPSVLRFPGGTVMGIYHWQDYVGPIEGRKKVKNIVWGGMMCREFGTAEFVQYCREIGAEPMICVNMPTGSAEEAAAWVEYCNGTEDTHYANMRREHGYEEPFNVKYWCIGNESFAEPDLGVQHEIATYIREAWEYTKYMKMTDPTIELVYVGNGADAEWNKAVLDSLSPVCDYLSIHFYASTENVDGGQGATERKSITESQCFGQLRNFENGDIAAIEKLIDQYNEKSEPINKWLRIPGRSHQIKIALDEWNIWNTTPNEKSPYGLYQEYTWSDALWTAEFIIFMLRHAEHIGIANLAQMVNVIAPIMVDERGAWKQTTFYPFKYFREYCGEYTDDLDCMNNDQYDDSNITTFMSFTDNERILFAVNKGSNPDETITFAGKKSIIITAEDLMAVNDYGNDKVHVLIDDKSFDEKKIPAWSIAILVGDK